MPTVRADHLTRISAALLRAAGASEDEADAVAIGCVNANLAGHDSHGVIAVPTYIDGIEVEDATWEKLRALAREYRLDTVLDLT